MEASPLAKVASLGSTAADARCGLVTLSQGKAEDKPRFCSSAVRTARILSAWSCAAHGQACDCAGQAGDAKNASAENGAARERSTRALITVYVIPRPDPDASEAFFQPPNYSMRGERNRDRRRSRRTVE